MVTTPKPGRQRLGRFVVSGAIAGLVATLGFTVAHHVLISSIWFAILPMLLAGALCGSCLAWSYALIMPASTARSWALYNTAYLAMFVALGLTSLATFAPVTTIAALLASTRPPTDLIGRALPMTALFSVATTVLLSVWYRATWRACGALFVTTATLVLLLGLNISILGLVVVPTSESGVLLKVFGLLAGIFVVYAVVMVVLEPDRFRQPRT